MATKRKIALLATGALLALLLLVLTSIVFFVNGNAFKLRLEAAASDALGMEVRIGGRLGIGIFPGVHVTMKDVRIRNREADVASATEVALGFDSLSLLHKEVRVVRIGILRPRISIEQDRDGKFNFESPERGTGKTGGTRFLMDVSNVSLTNGALFFKNRKTGDVLDAGNFSLDVSRLQLAEGKDLLKKLSFSATAGIGKIRTEELVASDLKFTVTGKNGILDLDPVSMRLFGGQGSGSLRADFSGAVPRYHVRYALSKFRIEKFFETLSPKKVAEGSMDFSSNLSMQGKTAKEMKRSASGEVSIRGGKLTLDGVDLDRTFARYESSQSFNLVDVGAFFFAGPFAPLITKAYNFASIYRGTGGSSNIQRLVSDWRVERGVARAKDVALATAENRIALQGSLDFVNERFNDVTVAVVDTKGCAKVKQKIRGPFAKPVVENASVLQSVAGPVLNLIRQAEKFMGKRCEVFYAGSVAPPK